MRWLLCCFVSLAASLVGCTESCPAEETTFVRGDEYCGASCAACDQCEPGFSCQLSGGQGVCVDEAFLAARGASITCVDPCPTGQRRIDDDGMSVCTRICTVDGECDHCCFEPADVEITVCAPRAERCL